MREWRGWEGMWRDEGRVRLFESHFLNPSLENPSFLPRGLLHYQRIRLTAT
jgi:hypothetical protein